MFVVNFCFLQTCRRVVTNHGAALAAQRLLGRCQSIFSLCLSVIKCAEVTLVVHFQFSKVSCLLFLFFQRPERKQPDDHQQERLLRPQTPPSPVSLTQSCFSIFLLNNTDKMTLGRGPCRSALSVAPVRQTGLWGVERARPRSRSAGVSAPTAASLNILPEPNIKNLISFQRNKLDVK